MSHIFNQLCTVTDEQGTAMYCPSPGVDLSLPTRRRRQVLAESPPALPADQEPTRATLGFIMDDVADLLQWSVNNERSFQYFQNPNYTMFETIITEGDKNLQIEVLLHTVCLSIICPNKMMQFALMYAFLRF